MNIPEVNCHALAIRDESGKGRAVSAGKLIQKCQFQVLENLLIQLIYI